MGVRVGGWVGGWGGWETEYKAKLVKYSGLVGGWVGEWVTK